MALNLLLIQNSQSNRRRKSLFVRVNILLVIRALLVLNLSGDHVLDSM